MAGALQDYEQPTARPTFITVLCILTFIGSGWGIVSKSIEYFTADTQAAAFSMVKEKANTDIQRSQSGKDSQFAKRMINSLNITPANIRKGALSNIAASILCLTGAFLMWNLKRTGFYLYVAGTLTGIIAPFVIFGGSNMMSVISSVVLGFVGLIFVILYGVNLRYMK